MAHPDRLIVIGLLWRPVLRPAGQAAILLADIYSEQLVGTNVARVLRRSRA